MHFYPSSCTATSTASHHRLSSPHLSTSHTVACSLKSCPSTSRLSSSVAVRRVTTHNPQQFPNSVNTSANAVHATDISRKTIYGYYRPTDSQDSFTSSSSSPMLESYRHSAAGSTPASPCLDCVVDCDDTSCSLPGSSLLSSSSSHSPLVSAPCSDASCTDQCVIVPCNDASHVIDGTDTCFDNTCFENIGECFDSGCVDKQTCSIQECFSKTGDLCTGGQNCTLDDLCCADPYTGLMQSPVVVQYYSNWGRPSVGLPNSGVGHGTRYHGQEQGLHNNMHSHPGIPHGPEPHQLAASRLMGNTGHSHTNSIDSLHQHMSGTTTLSIPTPPSAGGSSTLIRCMWDNCQETFASMSELVGHVNLTHLRPQAQAHNGTNLTNMNGFIAEAQPQLEKQPAANTFSMNHLPLSCMWENCQTFPDLSGLLSLPAATSESSSTISDPVVTSESWDAAMQLLSSHLLHDHLGLVGGSTVGTAIALGPSKLVTASAMARLKSAGEGEQPQTTPSTPPEVITQDSPLIASTSSHSGTNSKPVSPFSHPIPTPSASPPPSPHHDCTTSQHICKWAPSNSATPCNASFATCALLTEHLTTEHVGTGKSSYECHWDGCSRKGEQGFGSKQKVLRHLQSHTGHRPFQCDVCGLWFSEAATLGQHMRRHTQEKPFVCDFPGCTKAFAIAGALTIHKRTHNGERPFKCPHCERAFAESSNLSKHLRTHTGARPYVCQEPGCDKAFARPDQLQRHANVHRKAANAKDEQGHSVEGSSTRRRNSVVRTKPYTNAKS